MKGRCTASWTCGLALAGALMFTGPLDAAPETAPAAAVTTPQLKARLWLDDKSNREATLVGRTESAVVLAPDASGAGGRIEIARILRADFPVEYDRFEVAKALRRSDWSTAVRLLHKAYEPTFRYLDLPENDAAENVLDLGTYMMRAAARTAAAATTDEQQALARRQYESAHGIFIHCSRANWSSIGQLGVLKGCRCLLALGKPKTAAYYIDPMEEPTPGDAAYGHYWLVKAELAALGKDFRGAMDAAVKSVCFENKDVETFPDALILTARCYEELLEPYRARDVYFEVAKLFPRTDWAEAAVSRLKVIMAQKLTLEQENSPVASVFFGLNEDMNKLVEQLFKDLEKQQATEEEEEEAKPASRPAPPQE